MVYQVQSTKPCVSYQDNNTLKKWFKFECRGKTLLESLGHGSDGNIIVKYDFNHSTLSWCLNPYLPWI